MECARVDRTYKVPQPTSTKAEISSLLDQDHKSFAQLLVRNCIIV
jgi:hypothetical protein